MRQLALRVALRYTLPRAEAEDVAGEVVLRLWQMRDDLRRFSSVEALVARMARNESVSWLRRRPCLVELEAAGLEATLTPDAEETRVAREETEWLESRLAALPPALSAVIEMRTRQSLTTSQIADTLGLSPASVRALLSKARRRLLEEIRRRNEIR